MFPIYQVVFFVFAVMLVSAAVMVIVARNPVYAILALVLCFVASAGLWLLLQAEFLGLVLIFVYVGAVMTLFLFVVMMLNIDLSKLREKFVRFLPIGVIVMALFIGLMVFVLTAKQLPVLHTATPNFPTDYVNTRVMGELLYSRYLFPFEIAGLILLVAIIASISLAFHGRKPDTRHQSISAQLAARKADRLRILKMKREDA